ncbi:MAG: hypothetical protein KBB83_06190 [Alphaproteobacteria bacterium]|nr:hypothetical protein [Alphaproteobacteria bacterium]
MKKTHLYFFYILPSFYGLFILFSVYNLWLINFSTQSLNASTPFETIVKNAGNFFSLFLVLSSAYTSRHFYREQRPILAIMFSLVPFIAIFLSYTIPFFLNP